MIHGRVLTGTAAFRCVYTMAFLSNATWVDTNVAKGFSAILFNVSLCFLSSPDHDGVRGRQTCRRPSRPPRPPPLSRRWSCAWSPTDPRSNCTSDPSG